MIAEARGCWTGTVGEGNCPVYGNFDADVAAAREISHEWKPRPTRYSEEKILAAWRNLRKTFPDLGDDELAERFTFQEAIDWLPPEESRKPR